MDLSKTDDNDRLKYSIYNCPHYFGGGSKCEIRDLQAMRKYIFFLFIEKMKTYYVKHFVFVLGYVVIFVWSHNERTKEPFVVPPNSFFITSLKVFSSENYIVCIPSRVASSETPTAAVGMRILCNQRIKSTLGRLSSHE